MMAVPTNSAIADVGGGASPFVDALLDRGVRMIAVLDVSPTALSVAKNRLGKRAEYVEWIEADVPTWRPTTTFDLWHDRAVLHFLTEAGDQARYVCALRRALRPDGHVIVGAFAVGGPRRCSDLDIVQYDDERIRALLGAEFRLLHSGEEAHRTPRGAEQTFA